MGFLVDLILLMRVLLLVMLSEQGAVMTANNRANCRRRDGAIKGLGIMQSPCAGLRRPAFNHQRLRAQIDRIGLWSVLG
jgi:hypothetical protein